jgi:GH15 family glucan-1,4-alpha-glucosidase
LTLRLTDALALAPGARGHEIGREVPHAIVRRAEVLEGEVQVALECRPRLEYGLAVAEFAPCQGGVATRGGPERLFVYGDRPLRTDGATARSHFELRAGERAGFVLHRVPGAYADAPDPLDADGALDDAVLAWRSWAQQHDGYEGLHRDAVRIARLVLQGLTYRPSGGVVAAATTSRPTRSSGRAATRVASTSSAARPY